MVKPGQLLNDNALKNIYKVKKLIHLIAGTDEETIANSHWVEEVTYDCSSFLKTAASLCYSV